MLSDRGRQVDWSGSDERCLSEAHEAPAGHHESSNVPALDDPAGVEHEGCLLQFHNDIIFQFPNFANTGSPGTGAGPEGNGANAGGTLMNVAPTGGGKAQRNAQGGAKQVLHSKLLSPPNDVRCRTNP